MKSFIDLENGDKVYVLNFAVYGVPTVTKEEISIVHKKCTSEVYINSFSDISPIKVKNNGKLIITGNNNIIISPNKEEVVKRYKSFLNGMIKQYMEDIEKCQKNIKEYEEALNQVKLIK